ncbi:glycoside hydrolase family 47 protein [Myriangium duriaei CBS 260.36]|uniref:alpha-1,2-Mannosidase n=1 Tax=Myriangium duriaei CBS 260.36 TaxID=1168546 RepID=A0A9P4JEU3_9PEZI|nr:glycoside hydrolase family 47 protein [Myriangium duriaei CBS 260.36]
MLRYRRYRAFLVFAVFVVFGLYYSFSKDSSWQPSTLSAPSLDRFSFSGQNTKSDPTLKSDPPHQPDLGGERKAAPASGSVRTEDEDELPRKYGGGDKALGADKSDKITENKDMDKPVSNRLTSEASSKDSPSSKDSMGSPSKAGGIGKENVDSALQKSKPDALAGQESSDTLHGDELVKTTSTSRARVERPTVYGTVHWSKQLEHFPVSSTIPLPTGTPKSIPKVQAKFQKETKIEKQDRLEKLNIIRGVAKKNWDSYKEFAWMHDELSPVYGGYKDPFGGWAATLVDALDTLYIMGFVDEFDEAVQAVKTIDFTQSVRDDIPLFETVIRYLGGMLGAYDVSGAKYRVLLEKSVELAEILMGAFDTPNRMPVTFYQWKPAFASQPHRAGNNIVMAELGTLSMEFTRLAQLTKEPKYYDAIDRITDAFVEWQTRPENGTLLPGLFPLNVDASGCLKPDPFSASLAPQWFQPPVVEPEKALPAKAESRVDMGETGLTQKPKEFEQRKKSSSLKADANDSDDSTSEPLRAGEPGRSKIAGFDAARKKDSTGTIEASGEDLSSPKKAGLKKPFDEEAATVDADSKTGSSGKKVTLSKSAVDADDVAIERSTGTGAKSSKGKDLDKTLKRKRQLDGGLSDEPDTVQKSSVRKSSKASSVGEDMADTPKSSVSEGEASVKATSGISSETAGKPVAVPPSRTVTGTTSYLPEEMELCAPSNLTSGNKHGRDRYSLSGMADSTYEYFQKEYLLLGGLEEKYRGLHERSMDAATEYLLFRPLVPGNHDILISGDYDAWPGDDLKPQGERVPETAHLACFTGGMYALGAKLFDRPKDLEIAAKLTEGCVWAYNITKTGVMPEAFALMACESKTNCKWDEKKYFDVLDPQAEWRQQVYEKQLEDYEERIRNEELKESKPKYKGDLTAVESKNSGLATDDSDEKIGKAVEKASEMSRDKALSKSSTSDAQETSDDLESTSTVHKTQKSSDELGSPSAQRKSQKSKGDHSSPNLKRRQLDETKSSSKKTPVLDEIDPSDLPHSLEEHGDDDIKAGKPLDYTGTPSTSQKLEKEHSAGQPINYTPQTSPPEIMHSGRTPSLPSSSDWMPQAPEKPTPPRSHEETVKMKIADQGLVGGMTRITQRKYILRPEAIESVWYMYRITGDQHWRNVGWDMFTAVNKATSTTYGNSAIYDVNADPSQTEKTDSQESFWLAETLKYYYLLFTDEDVISLDEWVLNTEAHPFKRPSPKQKM